jgi:hypothetical protein
MIEGGMIRRAVFAEGLWMVDANGEQPPRNPQKDLGSMALAAETGQGRPVSQSVDLPAGLPPEARTRSAA